MIKNLYHGNASYIFSSLKFYSSKKNIYIFNNTAMSKNPINLELFYFFYHKLWYSNFFTISSSILALLKIKSIFSHIYARMLLHNRFFDVISVFILNLRLLRFLCILKKIEFLIKHILIYD